MTSLKSPSHWPLPKILLVIFALVFIFTAFLVLAKNSGKKTFFSPKISRRNLDLPRHEEAAIPNAKRKHYGKESTPLSPFLIRRQIERVQFSKPEQLLKTLRIHKGMKILDFGTGSGQYAYLFAKALEGTGVIYASDISPEKIHYVEREIKRQGIKNIKPVLVNGARFDPFYAHIRVDLIFMAHTHFYLENQAEYFSRLKASLNPQGRLALLANRQMTLRSQTDFFKPEDITDLPGLLAFLKQNPSETGPFALLGSEILRDMPPSQGGYAPKAVKARVVSHFNRMLSSNLFLNTFFDEKGNLNPAFNLLPDEKKYAEWLMRFSKEESPLFKEKAEGAFLLRKFCQVLINQILIIGQFRPFLFGGQSPYLPEAKISAFSEEKELLSKLGYQLEGEYNFIPFETLLLFSLPQSEENGRIQNTKASWSVFGKSETP